MTDIVKLVLIGVCLLFLINIALPKIIDFFVRRNQNKLISKIFKSDPAMKQLIENVEQKTKKKVKFEKHPLSIFYNDIYCAWGINRYNRLLVPLDKNETILPRDMNRQIFNLAHELVHIQENDFKKKNSCGYKFLDCLLKELKANLLATRLLREVNIEIGKQIFKNQKQEFWSNRLKITADVQCEQCHQIVKQKQCPEFQKILEYLQIIASEANLKLIIDPVSSKKNGVISYFNNFKNCSTDRVFIISSFLAQPRLAWAMPNSKK